MDAAVIVAISLQRLAFSYRIRVIEELIADC
jgi:hypothetical protein